MALHLQTQDGAKTHRSRTEACREQLQWLKGQGYVVRPVKSHRSRRPVSIDVDLVDVLRSYKVRQNKARLQAGELWQAGELVFTNEEGRQLTPDQVRRALLRALKVTGLPRIRPHDLRHTHVSVLLRLRAPMKVVQERLGHSTFAITADTYSHVGPICNSRPPAPAARRYTAAAQRVRARIGAPCRPVPESAVYREG